MDTNKIKHISIWNDDDLKEYPNAFKNYKEVYFLTEDVDDRKAGHVVYAQYYTDEWVYYDEYKYLLSILKNEERQDKLKNILE